MKMNINLKKTNSFNNSDSESKTIAKETSKNIISEITKQTNYGFKDKINLFFLKRKLSKL
jgi:hypothetical protein